jgi:serine/threonine protein kinase/WD40 repeat protein
MSPNPFVQLFSQELTPEAFVQQGMRLLEGDFRTRALLALADWERAAIPAPVWAVAVPELFTALAALQRPSWGNWNGLLTALRKARGALLTKGDPEVRQRLEGAAVLAAIIDRLDEPVEATVARGLEPLSRLVRSPLAARPRLGQVLALPIALRNSVTHNLPPEPDWWQQAARALRPLLGLHARPPAGPPESASFPDPWFFAERDDLWAFNGIEKDFTPVYVSRLGKTRYDGGRAQALLLAFRRLLGKTGAQDRDFKDLLARLAPEDLTGVLFGDYLLGRRIGEGGFATVHLGRQLSTGRQVALKVLRDGLGEEQRRRFHQEAALLARLEHPAVVQVLGRGEETWSVPRQGVPTGEEWYERFSRSSPIKSYIALEWVDGQTLEGVYRRGPAGRPEVRVLAGWFAQAAEALAAVHAEGLIHRDVKPSNLMVTEDGRVKLMDFGIARGEEDARTLCTATGAVLGTPAYMAPEQIEARVEPLTAAADVYSLCATFYELFAGARLFRHDTEEPDAVRARKLEGERPQSPPGLPWEIETLLLGGLEREPKDRPKGAADLATDLRRFLANEPIRYNLRPPPLRRAQLFYRRKRGLVHIVAGSAALLVLVAAFTLWRIGTERGQTEEQRLLADAEEVRHKREQAQAEVKAKAARESGRRKFIEEYFADMQEAPALFAAARVETLLQRLRRYERPGDDDPRGFEWHYWWRVCHRKRAARAGTGGPVKARDPWGGQEVSALYWHEHGVLGVAVSPDGNRVAAFCVGGPHLQIDARTGQELRRFHNQVAHSADGTKVSYVRGLPGHVAYSADGTKVSYVMAVGIYGPPSYTWDAQTGKLLQPPDEERRAVRAFEEGRAASVAPMFSPDGTLLADTVKDGGIRLWVVSERRERHRLKGHAGKVPGPEAPPVDVYRGRIGLGRVWALAFSPDGKTLASGGEDRVVRLWDVTTGAVLLELSGHNREVTGVAFSPDGRRLVSTTGEANESSNVPGEVKLWDLATGRGCLTLTGGGKCAFAGAAFSPDGRRLFAAATRLPEKSGEPSPGAVLVWEATPPDTGAEAVQVHRRGSESPRGGIPSARPGWEPAR